MGHQWPFFRNRNIPINSLASIKDLQLGNCMTGAVWSFLVTMVVALHVNKSRSVFFVCYHGGAVVLQWLWTSIRTRAPQWNAITWPQQNQSAANKTHVKFKTKAQIRSAAGLHIFTCNFICFTSLATFKAGASCLVDYHDPALCIMSAHLLVHPHKAGKTIQTKHKTAIVFTIKWYIPGKHWSWTINLLLWMYCIAFGICNMIVLTDKHRAGEEWCKFMRQFFKTK